MVLALVLLSLSISTGYCARRRISDVYLLLPQTMHAPSSKHVQYKIQAYEGCYQWSTANSKIVALSQVPGPILVFDPDSPYPSSERSSEGMTCFPEAVLKPISTVESPPVTLITATDLLNQDSLKCEVKLSKIRKLEILTTVKSFRVQDYQTLIAQAYDEEGNVFSSLEGLRFKWQIVNGNEAMGIPRLKDSLVTSSEARREIENSNYMSDVILVEGKSTGVANISLKIEEPGYENIPVTWTSISISEPFALVPSPQVYLPPRSALDFELYKIYEGKDYFRIQLPSREYSWHSLDYSLIDVSDSGTIHTKDQLGKTSLQVKDTKIESNTNECEVSIVEPDRMLISVEPFEKSSTPKDKLSAEDFSQLVNPPETGRSNWNLISDRTYVMTARLFWRDKELTIPRNAKVSLSFSNTDYWDIVSRSKNGAQLVVVPKIPNNFSSNTLLTKVYGQLDKVESLSGSNDWIPPQGVSDTQEPTLIRPVKITQPSPVVLPYFGVFDQKANKEGFVAQEFRLKSKGGSNSLTWQSSDADIATVNSNGIIYAHKLGRTQVSVVDMSNTNNTDSIEVEVVLIDKLIWNQERKEVVVSKETSAEIVGVDARGRHFSNCSSINLSWDLRKKVDVVKVSKKAFVDDFKRESGVCEIRNFEGLKEGQALLSANLIHQPSTVSHLQPEIRIVSEEGKIGVFKPLSVELTEHLELQGSSSTKTVINDKNAVILIPGSSATLTLSGGPLPWEDHPDSYTQTASHQLELKSSVQTEFYDKKSRKLYFSCPEKLVNTDHVLQIEVHNSAFKELKNPGKSVLELSVGCYTPNKLSIEWERNPSKLSEVNYKSLPNYFDNFKRKISSKFYEGYWAVLNNQELMFNVSMWDIRMREFYNFSNAQVQFTSDSPNRIELTEHLNSMTQKTVRVGFSEGPNTLTALVSSLKSGETLPTPVSASLNSEVVQNVYVNPNKYSLYLHKQNLIDLLIDKGSGHFEVSSSTSDISQYTYDGNRKITLYPKRAGNVQIQVKDIGLPGSEPASADILISPIEYLHLKEGGLLPVNNTQTLYLVAFDTQNKPFDLAEQKWMDLKLSFESPGAFEVVSVSECLNEWVIKGVRVGDFQIYAYGNKHNYIGSGPVQRSNTIMVDVFPPLEISPSEILILPGSKFTLSYKGGPDPSKFNLYGIATQWLIKDPSVAEIDSTTGLVSARKEGSTDISLKMLRKRQLLTETYGTAKVKLATGLEIAGMSTGRKVLSESATRLIAVLNHNSEPFTEAVMDIDYIWKSNSPTVYSIIHEAEDPGKQIGVTGLAIKQGKSDVSLHVEINYPSEYSNAKSTFESKVTVSVESGLVSKTPSHRYHSYISQKDPGEHEKWLDSNLFLVPPYSSYKLRLNKEDKTSFRCNECREDFLKVSESGQLFSYGQFGEVSVVAKHPRTKGDYHVINVAITEIESIHVDKSYLARTMALGSELELPVIYQDSMARTFPSGFEYGMDVGLQNSNSKVVSASLEERNSTLVIRSQYVGDAIIKVYLNNDPRVRDLISIRVSSVMKPVAPVSLHLGGEVQFETSHNSPAGVKGQWSVEDSSVLSIQDTGKAKASQEGQTYVHYTERSMDLKSLVRVFKVRNAELSSYSPQEITNYENHPSYSEKYRVPVKLFMDSEGTKEMPKLSDEEKRLVNHNLGISCTTSSHLEWVSVTSEVDLSRSEPYSCVVTPISNPGSVSVASKDLALTVKVFPKSSDLYSFEKTLYIPFIPKFLVPPHEKHIVLSARTERHTFVIGGSCSTLQVNPDSSLIGVSKKETDYKCLVEVQVLETSEDLRMKKLNILDSVTGQRDEVLVSYYLDSSKVESHSVFTLHDLIVLVAIGLITFLLFCIFSSNQGIQPQGFRQPPSGPPRPPGPPGPPRPPGPNGGPSPYHSAAPPSTPGSSAYRSLAYRSNL